jgi:UDP-xylose/UDP-N-acetylglucosamine transporter B4
MGDAATGDVVHRNGFHDPQAQTSEETLPTQNYQPSNGHISKPLRHGKSDDTSESDSGQRDLALAITSTIIPEWLNIVGVISLIFGGCCSNVFALEAIVKEAPGSGTLITFFQVLLTALFTLPKHVDTSRGLTNFYLKPRSIPLHKWALFAALFITINILNNKAFGYHISVPLHIILRSAGPVATMAVGFAAGKHYHTIQVVAVLMLFLGVVQAAISDARAKGANIQLVNIGSAGESSSSTTEFWTGFSILFLALMLSAFMGLFTDRLYAKHGRGNSEENLFYSHLLSLPVFLFGLPHLQGQLLTLTQSPSSVVLMSRGAREGVPGLVHQLLQLVPVQILFLLMNGLTQYVCIRGVNQLSAKTSSLTVGIVLNIRKLVSLLLSIWLFGNELDTGVLVGAAIVFVGGALYAWPVGRKNMPVTKEKGKKEL